MGSLSSCSWVCGSPTLPRKDTLRGRARHSSFQKSDDGVCRGREGMSRAGTTGARPCMVSWARLALPGAGSSAKVRLCSGVAPCPGAGRETGPTCWNAPQGSGSQPGPKMAGVALGQSSALGAEAGETLECHGVLTMQVWGVSS